MQKQTMWLLFFCFFTLFSCKEDDETEVLAAPTITVAPDATVYATGETATITIDVNAPGQIRDIVIGSTTLTNFSQETSVQGVTSEYVIPENAGNGDHKVMVTVTDMQTPAKSATAEAILKVNTVTADDCADHDESEVISGTGNIPVSDFTSNESGLLKEIIINNPLDKGAAGEENPSGCGLVMEFDKTPGEWDGWNGFRLVMDAAFSAEEFQSFGREGATKTLMMDVYRGEKAGSGTFPVNGLPIYVNLGNQAKFGDHPVGRSQYLIGTLTKNNEWETVSFYFNSANSGDIDADVADNETDMMEFLPAGGIAGDGGLYYFDNLRFEEDPDAGSDGGGSLTAETVCDFDADEAALVDAGWTKIFEDDFTSDLSKWNIWNSGAYNNELQHYQEENLEIADGELIITSKRETVTGITTPGSSDTRSFNFTSGRIESKETISANPTTPKVRMVARIRWPSGVGMWPAFWSYGDAWPSNGEIDVLEARGHEPNKYHTNYFYGTQPGTNLVQNATGTITADADLTTCYHVYELVWEENSLTSYLDGQLVEVKTSGGYIEDLFGKSHNIVLNLAVGGDFFGTLDPETIEPGAMYVDYVKVYTSN